MQRPTGTVTLLFTDIEGSTKHWEERGTAMPHVLRRHDELLRGAIETNSGYVFKTVGDAFCAAFWRAYEALTAAAQAQQALAAADWSDIGELRVRMALHTGAHDERDGDYFGPSVNRVARLMAVAHGGQVVISSATAHLLQGALPSDSQLLDLGEHRLKDLVEPERVWQLLAPGLQDVFPPLRSLESFPNNLPRQLTPLVGREAVVVEIGALVRAHPLVTVVGTGGVGKTRVTLQVGAETLNETSDGVWVVELAALTDPSQVIEAIAATLGTRARDDRPLREVLLQHLKRKRLLLILDNCEHVVDEVASIVTALVRDCSEICVLATSREPLRIAGESVYRLPSLDVPYGESVSASAALQYGAVALFAERAAAVDGKFSLTDDNATVVVEICRRLDGIALAIELAAARVKVLAPRQLSEKLDERFRVLTGGSRSALPRQQTMRALIDWSYDLLTEKERTLFRRLSIFTNGWTLEACCAVCAGDGEPESWEVLDLLTSLIDKSLVTVAPAGETERYGMLESTHAFAREKLVESLEADTLALRHALWAADLADRTGAAATSFLAWMGEFEPEIDNARAAIDASLRKREVSLAARIAAGFAIVARTTHGEAEPRRWLETVLPLIDETAQPSLAAGIWRALSSVTFGSRSIEAARRALELDARGDDPVATLRSLYWLVLGLLAADRLDEAQSTGERALQICLEHRLTHSFRYALLLDALARIAVQRGRIDEARRYYDEGRDIAAALGDYYSLTILHLNLGELELESGDVRRALECTEAAAAAARAGRCTGPEADSLMNAAAYRLVLGDIDEAKEAARASLILARRVQSSMTVAITIAHLATVAALRGDVRKAARLRGFVDAWYAGEGFQREVTEQQTGELLDRALRQRLSSAEIEALAAEGARLSEAQAASEALTV